MVKKKKFNEGWLFRHEDEALYAHSDFIEEGWQSVSLPHDWSIQYELREDAMTGPGGGFVEAGIGWYRKHFVWQKKEDIQKVSLLFDGVYMDSTIYLNGKKIGGHRYGYSSFAVDMTKNLLEGKNVIAVRVDNSRQPNSRWYSGSGIYRNVWMVEEKGVHLDLWGIKCDTNGIYNEQSQAALQIQAVICNDTQTSVYTGIKHCLLDGDGKVVASGGSGLYLMPGEKGRCVARPSVQQPHLWTDEDPYLYTLESTVLCEGEVIDREVTKVGIRTAEFSCDKGFLLNKKPVKIKGMCVHHDGGLTGAASYKEVWKRRLMKLKDMGCNGIRCSHNPPDPLLLDLCDELGFLVMDELFDEWALTKNKNQNYYSEEFAYGSGQFFDQDARGELVSMLRRDYNHPSVILWSIGNEIPEQSSLNGVEILRFLQDICHEEDGYRMVTSACDNIDSIEPICTSREFENALDVVGYNYVGRWREHAETFYEKDHEAFPSRKMIGSENPSVGGRRGIYTGSEYTYATMPHEALWRYTISHDFVAGDYLWTGIDHLGETRYPCRGAATGPLDTAGFAKDSYYYFKSIWNKKGTTLHLLPHWNWQGEEGQFKQVICYTNCDEVRLYINGRFVGSRSYECPRYGAAKSWDDCWGKVMTTNDLHLCWDVPYEQGVLRAEGYVQNKLVRVEEVVTTKKAEALCAKFNVVSAESNNVAAEYKTLSAGSNALSANSNVASAESSTLSVESNVPSEKSDIASAEFNTASVQSNTVSAESDAPSEKSNTVAIQTNALPTQSNILSVKAGELAQIELACVDEDGRIVPDAAPMVACEIRGNAHLIGMDSGDLYDLNLYSNHERKMSAGLLLATIQMDAPGIANVIFTSQGLKSETVILSAE